VADGEVSISKPHAAGAGKKGAPRVGANSSAANGT
jgi:hypothetical protein